jgi:hypothetical protein
LSLFAEQVSGSSLDTEIVDGRSASFNVVWVAP